MTTTEPTTVGPWRTSTRSNTGGGQCVQARAAVATQRVVQVHLGDSKLTTETPILNVDAGDYHAFLSLIRG